jgi:hypothetical protein
MRAAPHRCLIPALAIALAACSGSKPPEDEPNAAPNAYKQEIMSTLSRTREDAAYLREASISEPALAPAGSAQRYTACLRFTGRDGWHEQVAYFYGGHLNQLVETSKGPCATAAYQPFPELEKLCQATKCDPG